MATTQIKRDGQLSEVVLGNLGARVNLRGYDGVEIDPATPTVTTSTGNYGLIEQTTHGKHVAVPLAATSVTAAPTAANSVLLVEDDGLKIGVGKYARLYDAAGTDYVELSSDADGGLVIGGSGANAGHISGLTWTTFAPGVTQSAALTMTINWARYIVIGKLATVQIKMTYSSGASVAGNNIVIGSFPAAIQAAQTGAYAVAGTAVFYDASTNTAHVGFAEFTSASQILGYRAGVTPVAAFGIDPNVAMAAGDVLACQLSYEVA